ncbi:type IX secretion system sortase PorU [Flavobacteriaceae sp. LMIT009]
MKKALLFILFFCFFLGFSQQKQFKIEWNGSTKFSTWSSGVEVPSFNKENLSFDHIEGLKFVAQWETSQLVSENNIEITNVVSSIISKNELKDLNENTIPRQITYRLRNSVSREKRSVHLEVSPIYVENGAYKKLQSFTVRYNYGFNRSTQASRQIITNSVMSQGSWYKFYIDKTGVFRLSRNFLNSLGVSTGNIDPRTIKVYGQGGAMLPMENSEFYPLDLTENPVKVVGGEDGSFDNGDYILFYGVGPTGYNAESNTNINAYTDRACYFINVNSGGNSKQIQTYIEPLGAPTTTIDTFHDYQFHEVDEYNLAKLGRRWFGDRFDFDIDKTFDFEFPNFVASRPINLKIYAAAVSEVVTNMRVRVNGNEIDNFNFPSINDPILATQDFYNNQINVGSGNISINLVYDNNGVPTSEGFLDYISIEGTRSLMGTGDQFSFKNNDTALMSGIGQYDISNASNIEEVWDVTDRFNITSILNSDSNSVLSFKTNLGEVRNYVALETSDYYEPLRESSSSVANQNIKGTVLADGQGQFQDIDYIIVAREDMLNQAERLAQINRIHNGINVKVYELQQIYNEFSSGNQDISGIRNFIKYVYDNASAPENRIKYLCLFGDASFDYKERIDDNTNIVPSWHTYNSFSLSSSFISDDFFGMMDINEGSMHSSDRLDIAVGRILADTPQRAKEMVDKIESYYAEEAYGSWRNNFMMIADDVDESWEGILQETSNNIANEVVQNKPFMNAMKVYTDAFEQQSTAGGERYPSVNKTIFDNIEVGSLVVNYFGHGGEDGLAGERIFDRLNAQQLKNPCTLNCFVTVTCEYTKFDNPLRPTAGEYLYWNKDGGAIGLITTTRQIFVSVGVAFNVILDDYLFGYGTNDYPSMAEALRLTKNDPGISGISQRRLVFFIGDPAMKLAMAKPDIRLTEVNDVSITGSIDALSALSTVKLEGEVVDESGNLISDYNGIITVSVFDKEIDRQTLSNDGTVNNGQRVVLDFKTLGETIFRGQATVANGIWEVNFVVPRDIGVPVGNGKVSLYAKNNSLLQDRAGANFDVQIGGINDNAPEDNEGPVINLFINDESFVSGGITNESPTLLAKLQDENGINTASGIGHDIVAILDGDETNPFKLNDYYQTEVDNYQEGMVSYPFRDLEPGLHTLTLKAWDVYNNSSTSEIQFVVYDENEVLVIDNVLNYPNPFVNYTEFWFNHNSSEPLDVSVQIFTVSGKLVRTLNGQTTGGAKSSSSVSRDITWDGRDDFGEKIGKGVYVYKLIVRSNLLNKQVEKVQKLVIL